MKQNIKIYVCLIFVLFCINAIAQISFTAQAPRQVVQGNKFDIRFVLRNAEGENFQEPKVEGATKIYGPALSTSYSSQWVNGKSSSSSSQEYTLMYRADKAGTYTIPPATIEAEGKKYTTSSLTIEILPPDKNSQQNGQSQGVRVDDIDSQSASKPVNANDLFIRISMSKQKVYEQEAVVCTIKLFTKYQISQFMTTLQPSFDGFLIEELPLEPSLNNVEHYNGQNYMVAELKKCILFPQKSGKLTITSGNYDVTAVQYEQVRSLFGIIRQPVERKLKVKSNSATVNILPLPSPKPTSFSGAVGKFKVNTEVKSKNFKTYEAATYSYTISGSGNIKYLKAPEINFPSQFDVYDPQNDVNAKVSGQSVSGSNKFEYTFIPQYVGDYEIPASTFTYFDPASAKYVNIEVPATPISVAKGIAVSSDAVISNDLELKNKDILHIKTSNLKLKKEHKLYLNSFIYWLWYILPLIAVLGLMWYYRKTIKERSNIQLLKNRRANKVAKKRLKQAQVFLKANDNTNFYSEILKALWGYLSDKLSIPVSELNKENISTELQTFGTDENTITDLLSILDKCEFAQYAPELSGNNMSEVYNEVSEIMNKLENTKRK
ncbi:MAG: protein BatD [Bacteroidales bacterium]|nr:protein BatD [Bacteroidales bacterium]